MPAKVLVADDSPTIRRRATTTLSEAGYDVTCVEDGQAAWDLLQGDAAFSVLLCDILMPGLDGYELCRRVKAEPRLSSLPVLLLRGTFEPWDQAKAVDAGADGYVTKPFDAEALLSTLGEVMADIASHARPASDAASAATPAASASAPAATPAASASAPAAAPAPAAPTAAAAAAAPAPAPAPASATPDSAAAAAAAAAASEPWSPGDAPSGRGPASSAPHGDASPLGEAVLSGATESAGIPTGAPARPAVAAPVSSLDPGIGDDPFGDVKRRAAEPPVDADPLGAPPEDVPAAADAPFPSASESAGPLGLGGGAPFDLMDSEPSLEDTAVFEPGAPDEHPSALPPLELDPPAVLAPPAADAGEPLGAMIAEPLPAHEAPQEWAPVDREPLAPPAPAVPPPPFPAEPIPVSPAPFASSLGVRLPAGGVTLDEATLERLAELVAARLVGRDLERIAWEVVPDVAEAAVRKRLSEIEAQLGED